jgi:hypothetical protein
MKSYLAAAFTAAMLLGGMVAQAETAQQQKMTTCNADAKTKNLHGDERKAFMKSCLSAAGESAPKATTQQEKMKSCNAEAGTKALTGDARKSFMKTCLSAG